MTDYETEAQLKELYDELEAEARADKEELALLREEHDLMERLLDGYGIPRRSGDKTLGNLERIDLALRERKCA